MTSGVKNAKTSTPKSKKAYSSPVLKNYGSVADRTLGGDFRGSDGQSTNPCNPGNDSSNQNEFECS
jgi:hypothetical protein